MSKDFSFLSTLEYINFEDFRDKDVVMNPITSLHAAIFPI